MKHDLDTLGRLLTELPPAPQAWIDAAVMLPDAMAQVEDVAHRLAAEAPERAAETARLEQALREAGIEPDARARAALRCRLEE